MKRRFLVTSLLAFFALGASTVRGQVDKSTSVTSPTEAAAQDAQNAAVQTTGSASETITNSPKTARDIVSETRQSASDTAADARQQGRDSSSDARDQGRIGQPNNVNADAQTNLDANARNRARTGQANDTNSGAQSNLDANARANSGLDANASANQILNSQDQSSRTQSQLGSDTPSIPAQTTVRSDSNAQVDSNAQWRFQRQNGEWWYYTPGEDWMYHRNNQWNNYDVSNFQRQGGAYGGNAGALQYRSGYRGLADDQAGAQGYGQNRPYDAQNNGNNSQSNSEGIVASQPSYWLQHDSCGREYICMNGSRVYVGLSTGAQGLHHSSQSTNQQTGLNQQGNYLNGQTGGQSGQGTYQPGSQSTNGTGNTGVNSSANVNSNTSSNYDNNNLNSGTNLDSNAHRNSGTHVSPNSNTDSNARSNSGTQPQNSGTTAAPPVPSTIPN